MTEQIIINWTSDEDKNTLIINATIDGERIAKVVKDPKKEDIELLKNWIQNGN